MQIGRNAYAWEHLEIYVAFWSDDRVGDPTAPAAEYNNAESHRRFCKNQHTKLKTFVRVCICIYSYSKPRAAHLAMCMQTYESRTT